MMLEVEGDKRLRANLKEKKTKKETKEASQGSVSQEEEDVQDWIGKIKGNRSSEQS